MRTAPCLIVIALLSLSGCGSAVEVGPLPSAQDQRCQAAARAWPEKVLGKDRRKTTPGEAHAAAWGDPAIIARCGAEPPPPSQDPCVTVDGVDWVMTELADGKRFVSYGRAPALEVLVPRAHAPEPEVLPRFAEAARHLAPTGRRCQ